MVLFYWTKPDQLFYIYLGRWNHGLLPDPAYKYDAGTYVKTRVFVCLFDWLSD